VHGSGEGGVEGRGRGRKGKNLAFVPGLCGPELQSVSV